MVMLGVSKTNICPVAAILDYLGTRRNAPGLLFTNIDGSPPCKRQFMHSVQHVLTQTRVNGKLFNGHSFRIGASHISQSGRYPKVHSEGLGSVAEYGLPGQHLSISPNIGSHLN